MPDAASQREFALQIAKQLRGAGYEAVWAGGCVRDRLLGYVPKDYDVATNATPEQIRDLFGRRRTLPIGMAFGVVSVLGPRAAGQIDVATFRTDATYSDGRHPDHVTFTNAEHDAQRRDFTINGLFYDPIANEVIDYVGGQGDLARRIVRAIGDPRLRLAEDKLRMLRAVRFAATFEFAIEPVTLATIQEMAPDILTVSAERIGMELRRMLVDRHRATAIALLRESKLLPHVLPEVAQLSESAFLETARILHALDSPTLSTALAALLCQPPTPDAHLAGTLGRRLKYTNKEIERTAWLLAHLPTVADAPTLPWPRVQRILIHDGAAEILALHGAIAGSNDRALAFCRERLSWPVDKLNPAPLVDGADLIGHGLKPGPVFSNLLEQVRDAQLNGEIHATAEALALVDRLRAAPNTLR
ncbi:MAG: CCA tRNA nucleotidyltransferase [Pirellulales bacterium]|nr:CCA tRNA nucleotidyltransferase [Pirellulales bacterium]